MNLEVNERVGYRWVWAARYKEPFEVVSRLPVEAFNLSVDKNPVEFGPPVAFVVADAHNLSDVQGEFETAEEAASHAEKLNRADVEKGWDPAFKARRDALRHLGETFWVRYGDGPLDARWPQKPGRYAVLSWSERYSESFWETCETLDEVEAEVLTGDAERIIDLDTEAEIPFELKAVIGG